MSIWDEGSADYQTMKLASKYVVLINNDKITNVCKSKSIMNIE